MKLFARCVRSALCLVAVLLVPAAAQAQGTLRLLKIDPPNWWAAMPKPMLLVRGEGLSNATFALSDKHLRVERTQTSANGHWAILWLNASPQKPETITIAARVATGAHAEKPYTFAQRRTAQAGFAGFSSRDVMYLVMTDRFADGDLGNDGPLAQSAASSAEAAAERAKSRGWHGGDLRGLTAHLDYLQQFGVTTLWPTPVYENHRFDSYHGYGATDMFRVDEHYGTLADLQALSAALHARGMKLVLDEVPNHVGPGHPWVHDSPLPDWFHGTAEHHRPGDSNFVGLIDAHAPPRDTRNTTEGWFVGILPDMNTENPAVAQYLAQNVIWWVEQTAADGVRIDTFPYIARPFWKPYLDALHRLYPHLTEVGEAKSVDPLFTSAYAGGVTRAGVDTGLWTPFDFPLDGALHDAFAKGGSLSLVAAVFAADNLYPHPERLVTLLDNHDEARFRSEAASAAGMRLALGVLLTARGLPQLYSGDELAMPGGGDPDNRHDFPGGFPGDPRSAFTPAGRTPDEATMFDWTARLTALRRAHPALQCGTQQALQAGKDTLVYARLAPAAGCAGDERVVIAVARGQAAALDIPLEDTALAGCSTAALQLETPGSAASVSNHILHLELPADTVLVATCR